MKAEVMPLLCTLENFDDGWTREVRLVQNMKRNVVIDSNIYLDISTWSPLHDSCKDTMRIKATDVDFYSKFIPSLKKILN